MEKTFMAVIASCGGGDWLPVLALMNKLGNRGHKVIVICDNQTETAVKEAGGKTICLPQDLSLEKYFSPALEKCFRTDVLTAGTRNPFYDWASAVLPMVLELLEDLAPDCLIGSLFGMSLASVLAEKKRAPWLFVNPSFSFDGACTRSETGSFSSLGARMYCHWLWPTARRASLTIHATDSVFDGAVRAPRGPRHYCGPLFWEKDATVPAEIEASSLPWVLLSLSTAAQEDDLVLARASLDALASLPYRVLVTLSPDHDKALLSPLPEKVQVHGYIPHSKVISRCRFVISHAGHGTVLKTLSYGIPQILVPWGRDQPGVAARAEALGVAAVIGRNCCTKTSLLEGIREIETDNRFVRNSVYHAERMKKLNQLTQLCRLIERLPKP